MDLETLSDIKERLNLGGVSKEALIGIGVILIAIALVAARMLMGAGAEGIEVGRAEASQEQGGKDAGSLTAQEGEPAAATLFVHVSGAVKSPGLCEVGPGARVADAVQAAGGFSDDAAMDSVNLARVVNDGEQIVVATQAQVEAGGTGGVGANASGAAGGSAQAGTGGVQGRININTASAAELTQLPGIGEATAAKIVSDREANGAFKTIEDLKRVSGVGDKKFEALADLVCV